MRRRLVPVLAAALLAVGGCIATGPDPALPGPPRTGVPDAPGTLGDRLPETSGARLPGAGPAAPAAERTDPPAPVAEPLPPRSGGAATPPRPGGTAAVPPPPRVAGAPSSGDLPSAPMPARLVQPAPEHCLAQIETFAERHTGTRVMLGTAAFADSDRLVLTRTIRRVDGGPPLDGRLPMPQPAVFALEIGPRGCQVRHVADGAGVGGPGAAEGRVTVDGGADAAPPDSPLPACRCAALSP